MQRDHRAPPQRPGKPRGGDKRAGPGWNGTQGRPAQTTTSSEQGKEVNTMSFSYTAAGSKHAVAAQLDHQAENCNNTLGRDLARLLAGEIRIDAGAHDTGHEVVYAVKAHGHSGFGSTLSLNATVEAHHVRKTDAAADGKSGGERAYEAYVKHVGGKSVHGEELPAWDDQLPGIRDAWEAAAAAAR